LLSECKKEIFVKMVLFIRHVFLGTLLLNLLALPVEARCVEEKSSYDKAELIKSANNGNVTSQVALGKLYLVDTKNDQALNAGLTLLKSAASGGSTEAQDVLGSYYLERMTENMDNALLAEKWLSSAAKSGYVPSIFHLGLLYYGKGKLYDLGKAYDLISRAASSGDETAEMWKGSMLIAGYGAPKNAEEGFRWIKKSADDGSCQSKIMLSGLYIGGIGTEKSPRTAIEVLEWIRSQNGSHMADAAYMLGVAYSECGSDVYDKEKAVRWLTVSAQATYADSEERLSKLAANPKHCISNGINGARLD